MMTWQPIWITLLLSLGMIMLMYRRFGTRDPLVAIFSFYLFFAYGPVLNYLMGRDIYFGIVRQRIFDATVIFTIVMATVFIVSNVVKPRLSFDNDAVTSSAHQMPALGFILVVFIGYTVYVLLDVGPDVWGQEKGQRIALGPGFHYQYLLLQMFIISLYFHVKQLKGIWPLYIINFVLYVAYCLIFAERDFIFLIISLVLHGNLLKNTKVNRKQDLVYMALVPLLIVVAILIAGLRRGGMGDSVFADAFNEGSILFIVTTILEWIDKGVVGFAYGQTYLNSLLNLLPGMFVSHRNELFFLSSWFANRYAPGGSAYYGFSLGAEAYLNFGYWGIPMMFTLFTLLQRWSLNRIGTHPFYLYFSVFFVSFSMYSLRNDSLALISGMFYASLFFFGVYFLSELIAPRRRRRVRIDPPVRVPKGSGSRNANVASEG